jgi:hypothetical protein
LWAESVRQPRVDGNTLCRRKVGELDDSLQFTPTPVHATLNLADKQQTLFREKSDTRSALLLLRHVISILFATPQACVQGTLPGDLFNGDESCRCKNMDLRSALHLYFPHFGGNAVNYPYRQPTADQPAIGHKARVLCRGSWEQGW